MSFKLSSENYFSPDRPHLSNSMLSTYKRSPELYKRRYIERDPEAQCIRTLPMKVGSLVDDLITRGQTDFIINPFDWNSERKQYLKFTKTHDSSLTLAKDVYEKALEIVEFIEAQPFFKDDKEFQVLLEGEIEGVPFCGLADWITPTKLVDLKTVSSDAKLSSPQRWSYHAWDMGYYRQFALYEHMLGKQIDCYWVVAYNAGYGVVTTHLFKADPDLKKQAFDEAVALIKDIKKKKFKSRPITWEDSQDLKPHVKE